MQREQDDPLDAEVVPAEAGDAPLAVPDEPLPPVVPDPATLIRGFRLLAERIPGFRHLTPEEERAMIRASTIDPEMIVNGLAAAEVWDQSHTWMGMTPAELRELDATIREKEEVEKSIRIFLRGVAGANRTLKHRRGKAILALYNGLKVTVDDPTGRDNHLRPYFENMQRAYMKTRKRRKGKEEVGKEEGREEEGRKDEG